MTTALHTDSDVHTGKLLLAQKENKFQKLVLQGAQLDRLQRPPIHLDEGHHPVCSVPQLKTCTDSKGRVDGIAVDKRFSLCGTNITTRFLEDSFNDSL